MKGMSEKVKNLKINLVCCFMNFWVGEGGLEFFFNFVF